MYARGQRREGHPYPLREPKRRRGRPLRLKGMIPKMPSGMTGNHMDLYEEGTSHGARGKSKYMFNKDAIKSSVMDKLKDKLLPEFPTFIKQIYPSQVSAGYWMCLPRSFCVEHLPGQDKMVILEDENGAQFYVTYLAQKFGLSSGWKEFCKVNKLLAGDSVVFQLVKTCVFKVYIVRSCDLNQKDGTPVAEQIRSNDLDQVLGSPIAEQMEHEHEAKISEGTALSQNSEEVWDGLSSSVSDVDFERLKSLQNFTIIVNGEIINHELSKVIRKKYFELCRSQRSILHDEIASLSSGFAVGAIEETVKIADAIRGFEISSSEDKFKSLDKSLSALEGMGMKVGFLRARMRRIEEVLLSSKEYQEIRLKRKEAEERKKHFEAKLLIVQMLINELDADIKTIVENSGVKEIVNAPW